MKIIYLKYFYSEINSSKNFPDYSTIVLVLKSWCAQNGIDCIGNELTLLVHGF